MSMVEVVMIIMYPVQLLMLFISESEYSINIKNCEIKEIIN